MPESNHIIPELLLKYNSNVLMINDFDYLKSKTYTEFQIDRLSSNKKELINKNNNNEILGTIYDLQSPKLMEQINNKETNINNNQDNNTGQHNISTEVQRAENGQAEIKDEIGTSDQTKQVLKGQNKIEEIKYVNLNNNYNYNNYNGNQTNFIINHKKKHLEFLLRLFCFEDKLNIRIKNSPQLYPKDMIIEDGYIVNHKIIENYKTLYKAETLRKLLSTNIPLFSIFSKYKNNNYNYVSENNVNYFIKETLDKLPKDYIKQIQENNNLFLSTDLNNIELFQPTFNYYSYQQQYLYFENCSLLNQILGKDFLSNILAKHSKTIYGILSNKIYDSS